MPFAQIYLIEGRTEEQKRAVIEKVTLVSGALDSFLYCEDVGIGP
jgi:4-oxalocrotonate tautomerase family enzyme